MPIKRIKSVPPLLRLTIRPPAEKNTRFHVWSSQHNHSHNAAAAANTHSFTFDPGKMVSTVQNDSTPVFALGSLTPVQSKTRRGCHNSGSKTSSSVRVPRGAVTSFPPRRSSLHARKKNGLRKKGRCPTRRLIRQLQRAPRPRPNWNTPN